MSKIAVHRDITRQKPAVPRDLLEARRPVVYFANKIGDSVLTLPTVRALADVFTAPLTLLCSRKAFNLCFHQASSQLIDITGYPPFEDLRPHQVIDYDDLASQIGPADVFINSVPWNMPTNTFIRPLREHIDAATEIGFAGDGQSYDIVVPKTPQHCFDLIFQLAHLLDPSLRIENYAQPVPIGPAVQHEARTIRARLGSGTKVLALHADSDWIGKQWPATRFIALLDRFLARHRDFVVWVVGMGHEDLNVGREGGRVISLLGLPLDLTMGLVGQADLFVGIDSCMLHAADLARVPGVGLFGPTRSTTWGFRFASHRHVERNSMAAITVDDVLAAMDDLIGDRGAQPRSDRYHPAVKSLLSAVRQFSETVDSWHEAPPTRSDSNEIAGRALYLHALNFELWHHEDAVRGTDVNEAAVAHTKRNIDVLNARRNAAIEDIDAMLIEQLGPHNNRFAPLHTETPATVADRLSVLALRIWHTNSGEGHGARLEVLVRQHADLLAAFEKFLVRLQRGETAFKVYRQFKFTALPPCRNAGVEELA